MDPLALAAVVGLVFAGQRLSNDTAEVDSPPTTKPVRKVEIMNKNFAQQDVQMDQSGIHNPDQGRWYNTFQTKRKEAIPSLQDVSKRLVYGQPVYDLYNRQNVTTKMNNLAPIERKYVGRGLGLSGDTPASGGFQQFFRVSPNNINEERLTTLPGGSGPANPVVKAGGVSMDGNLTVGSMTHQAKETKAWYRDPAQTRGQGQGGALTAHEARPEQIKTARTTGRQETGARTGDTFELGPPAYYQSQPYNTNQNQGLTRGTENRTAGDRQGNGGRMNVRADPIGAVGGMTNLRPESEVLPIRPKNGIREQQYQQNEFYKFNEFKANPNDRSLDIAIQQLEKNPLAQPPLSVV